MAEIKENPYLSKDYAKRMKARNFKCEACKREFYVPRNVYIVKCPCGKTGYSEKFPKLKPLLHKAKVSVAHRVGKL